MTVNIVILKLLCQLLLSWNIVHCSILEFISGTRMTDGQTDGQGVTHNPAS